MWESAFIIFPSRKLSESFFEALALAVLVFYDCRMSFSSFAYDASFLPAFFHSPMRVTSFPIPVLSSTWSFSKHGSLDSSFAAGFLSWFNVLSFLGLFPGSQWLRKWMETLNFFLVKTNYLLLKDFLLITKKDSHYFRLCSISMCFCWRNEDLNGHEDCDLILALQYLTNIIDVFIVISSFLFFSFFVLYFFIDEDISVFSMRIFLCRLFLLF